MKLRQVCLMAMVGGMVAAACQAGEYYVGLQGDDAHDGLSRATAFSSIQRGLDALDEGDVLTVLPGEYFGSAQREDLGGPDKITVIRAELPGTAVLRGDVPAPEFAKVPGRRFVYAADFDRAPQAVNELDTLTILESLPNPEELEFVPGAFHYDAANQRLYVSTSDLQPPHRHVYTVSVIPTHGLYLERPRRVVIEGLAFTGFSNAEQLPANPGFRVAWGLMLARGSDCIIRDCTAYFNGGGICLRSESAGGNLVERCRAHANYSKYCGEGGNILAFHPNRDVILDSLAHNSRVHGVRMYGTMRGPSSIRRCLGWGNGGADLYIKGDNVREFGRAEYSVAVDGGHVFNFHNSLIGGHNVYHREIATPRDNIRLLEESAVDPDVEFADPENLDFRLQFDSRFRGTGPGGADRGPYPYDRNIFYVSPDGSDTHDGLSSDTPWRSMARARGLRFLRPGDTVYLEGGVHDMPAEFWAGADGAAPVYIRGRGTNAAVIRGSFKINSGSMVFERLEFQGAVEAEDCGPLAFEHCRFTDGGLAVQGVADLRVTHCEFSGPATPALSVNDGNEIMLAGNIFANEQGTALRLDCAEALRYSDYNVYQDPANAWEVAGRQMGLKDLPLHDRYSIAWTAETNLRAGGPLGQGLGPYRAPRVRPLRTAGPFVHSVTDTTANLEWWTSRLTTVELAWYQDGRLLDSRRLDANGFASWSLTGLQPDTEYVFRVSPAEPFVPVVEEGAAGNELEIKLRTAARAAPPTTYYVAPDGDDAHAGSSRDAPLRSIAAAADRARAGDTVLVAGGHYRETVRVRGTGAPGNPVTFKALPGEQVFLDGDGRALGQAFIAIGKKHLNFDGFYFIGFSGAAGGHLPWRTSHKGEFLLYQSEHVRISRCFKDGRGQGYSPNFVAAWQCRDLLVENCVILGGFSGPKILASADVTFRNCVFYRNMIAQILVENFADQQMHLLNNIFTDSLPNKPRSGLVVLGRVESLTADNNAFFNRAPDAERQPIFIYGTEAWARVVEAFGMEGQGCSDSVVTENLKLSATALGEQFDKGFFWIGNPLFRAGLGQEFKDREGRLLTYTGDAMLRQVRDFNDLFATAPELVERDIGLQPAAFADFHFNR